ncbi:MAG: type II toxin-antitoxin system PemK/MazF family toxin [Microvirga sp.]
MRRGTIATVALSGDYGKPRPAVVIQSERLAATDSLLVCPLTSTQRDTPLYRLAVAPDAENGLRRASDIMVDKITAVRRARIGVAIGTLGAAHLLALDRMLALAVGIADRSGTNPA